MLTPIQAAVLKALNRERVRSVLVGGMAMRAHGIARDAHDLDLWIEATPGNAERVAAALTPLCKTAPEPVEEIRARAALPAQRIVVPDESAPEVDLLTSIGTLDFQQIRAAARIAHLDGQPVWLPTREHLAATKRAAISEMRKQITHGAPVPAQLQADIDRDEQDIRLLGHEA